MTPAEWAVLRWEDIKARELAHSLNVSVRKPLGQLGGYATDPRLHLKALWIQVARAPNVKVLNVHGEGRSTYYVYHVQGLGALLWRGKRMLEFAGWPSEPVEFVNHARAHHAPIQTTLYDLVADAYGDKLNPGRTDVLKGVARKVVLQAFLDRWGFNDPCSIYFPIEHVPMPEPRHMTIARRTHAGLA